MEVVYQNRDNPIVRELLQDGESPAPGITRVQAKVGDVCLDTNEDSEITLEGNVVTMVLGGTGLALGTHRCELIVYDANHPNGISWDRFWVVVKVSEACD